ncbi:MAG TPA: serine/threonine-protein kinase [Kofleriaceae bacterium]
MGDVEPVPSEPTTVMDKAPPSMRDGSRTPLTNTVSSAQVVDAVELQRVRGMMSGIAISSALTAIIVIIVRGEPTAMKIHAGALLGTAIAAGASVVWFHREVAKWILAAQVGVLMTGFYFWGFFSAYCVLVPLTMYILAGIAHRAEVWWSTITVVLAQTAFGTATILGWIESRGLVQPVEPFAPVWGQFVALGMLQLITIGAMLAGRDARKRSMQVLEDHNRTMRELARREAQLAEAYAEARAAREAGLGGAGRFTDQTIDGFRLAAVLGRGAMGEVYAAERLGEPTMPLAMKILAPHLLSDSAARERFRRESAIVCAMTSKHVVRVIAVSQADAVLPYIVMERLEGIDLAQLLKRSPVRPVEEIKQIVRHVAAGLDAAHKAGIVHRDLKPSNIFATGDGAGRIWKLLDFGASKWRDGEGTLTHGNIVGTPGYMAPEQAQGRAVDQRSDVYALGVILYRLVTGVPAVVPGEMPAMLQEVAFRMPVQPSKRAFVAPEVEAVLAIALAKSPKHRFSTAGELADALADALDGKLDRALTRRAEGLLHETPWGEWTKR